MKNLLYIFVIAPFFTFSQVGINTTNPQASLHVEGTFRVTQTNTSELTKLTGFDTDGTMGEITLGSNLQLVGNTLNTTGASSSSSVNYSVADITIQDGPQGQRFNDYNLQLSSSNSDKDVFIIDGRTKSYKISGFSGGTNGRRIVIINMSNNNLTFENESSFSQAQNRIYTLANNVSTIGVGTTEFVYSASNQRWIMLSIRK